MLNIQIERNSSNNCYDEVFVALAKYKERDFEVMFSGSWGCKFDKDSNTLNADRGDKELLLEKYHGIKLLKDFPAEGFNFRKVVEEELSKGLPVAVVVDTYYIPWLTQYYKLQHYDHVFLIIGYNDEEYFTTDSQFAKPFSKISLDDFNQGLIQYMTFEFKDLECQINTKELISKALNKIKNDHHNALEDLKAFITYYENEFDVEDALEKSQGILNVIPTFREMNNLAMGRRQFGVFMNYCGKIENNNYYKYLGAHFDALGTEWASITGLLLKAIFVKSKSRIFDLIISKMNLLYKQEYDLVNIFMNNFERSIESFEDTSIVDDGIILVQEINTEAYNNNKGLADCEFFTNASFSFPNRFFIVDKDNTKLKISNKIIAELNPRKARDNIVCNEQIINIRIDEDWDTLVVVGACEFEKYTEKVKFVDDMGVSREELLSFQTWGAQNIEDNNTVWIGDAGTIVNDDLIKFPFKFRLYKNQIRFNNFKPVSMELSYNPNMHIFLLLACKQV